LWEVQFQVEAAAEKEDYQDREEERISGLGELKS
jgi:hypothetical protein